MYFCRFAYVCVRVSVCVCECVWREYCYVRSLHMFRKLSKHDTTIQTSLASYFAIDLVDVFKHNIRRTTLITKWILYTHEKSISTFLFQIQMRIDRSRLLPLKLMNLVFNPLLIKRRGCCQRMSRNQLISFIVDGRLIVMFLCTPNTNACTTQGWPTETMFDPEALLCFLSTISAIVCSFWCCSAPITSVCSKTMCRWRWTWRTCCCGSRFHFIKLCITFEWTQFRTHLESKSQTQTRRYWNYVYVYS